METVPRTNPVTDPRKDRIGRVIFPILATILFALTSLALLLEAFLLATDRDPITHYVRLFVRDVPVLVVPAALAIGLVIGHVSWGAREGLTAPADAAVKPVDVLGRRIP
jgi:hypothetical protein